MGLIESGVLDKSVGRNLGLVKRVPNLTVREIAIETKVGGAKLQDVALTKDTTDHLPVTEEASRSTLKRTKRSLAFCLASEHQFLTCIKLAGCLVV